MGQTQKWQSLGQSVAGVTTGVGFLLFQKGKATVYSAGKPQEGEEGHGCSPGSAGSAFCGGARALGRDKNHPVTTRQSPG